MSGVTSKVSNAEPEKPKTLWDSILTSTPVILTVVATLLAGLSSSEMTRAQYHRSLAAQHQSKVADQWGFFQAKRIRGTSLETEVDLLQAQQLLPTVTLEMLTEYFARLPQDFERATREGENLLRASGSGADASRQELVKTVEIAVQNVAAARKLQQQLGALVANPEVREALNYLSTKKLPAISQQTHQNGDIDEARGAIRARKTEAETSGLMARIKEDDLQQVVETAESNAHAFEKAGKPIDDSLAAVALLVQDAGKLTATFHASVKRWQASQLLTGSESGNPVRTAGGSGAAQTPNPAAALAQLDANLLETTGEINRAFLAARRDFTARRYKREADDNQEIASVYEVQVRKSSWNAERHRSRSQLFFIGMLIAQAGVTIATLSLAVRKRSVLWVLAAVAGLAAIAFSGYVYLYT